MPFLATLALYLLAGTAIGLLALFSGIPAAPLAGALLGAVSYTHLTLPTKRIV